MRFNDIFRPIAVIALTLSVALPALVPADDEFIALIEELFARIERDHAATWSTLASIADQLRAPASPLSSTALRPGVRPHTMVRPRPIPVPSPPPIRY